MSINIILFDNQKIKSQLLPFTFTRPVSEIRCGILTIREKWEQRLNAKASYIVDEYLSIKFPVRIEAENLLIRSEILPDDDLIKAINNLKINEALFSNDNWLAAHISKNDLEIFLKENKLSSVTHIKYEKAVNTIERPWDIFRKNGDVIKSDFGVITKGKLSHRIMETNRAINHAEIFIEEGANVEYALLNASTGPIYIGKNATIMEGAMIRGPFAMCEAAEIKMGAKIYGPTTIGPYSKVGGELNNVVIFGYSNKAHDGFLGNAVIGEWCNLGADTNNSNLKNDYSDVKLWSYPDQSFIKTGLQFCGLMMGDHSKCGINTMFNTGTVIGVSSNIFGDGFPRNFIPSFSWGGAAGFTEYNFDKAMKVAKLVMSRRNVELTIEDEKIYKHVYDFQNR